MDERLKSMLCLLIVSLMAVMVTSSCSDSECESMYIMHVCMYVCTYIHTYVCMYVAM